MPTFTPADLRNFTDQVFQSVGVKPNEARTVAHSLIEANLVGHDSHGVMRIPEYVKWVEQEQVNLNATFSIAVETEAFAVIDGDWGWGQVVGRKAMEVAIEKASEVGVGTVSVRNCCHLGRVGEYPALAAEQEKVAVLFVNTHGGGKLVAPWGGRERRLSANPIAVAVPTSDGPAVVVDISTCAIAEGKLRVMLHRGDTVPEGCILDAEGQPSIAPAAFYGPPEGSLLPVGRHKGFALSFVGDILAGALSGAGCSRPDTDRVGNGFLAIVIDIEKLRGRAEFMADVEQLVEYVRSSALAPGFEEILIPGEPEARERTRREKDGIPVDVETWRQITETAGRYGVAVPES